MCRLVVTSVTSDLSRGKLKYDEDVLQSNIPRRPRQGNFPFDFNLAAAAAGQNNEEDVQPGTSGVQQQPMDSPDQGLRRSQRSRRRHPRFRGFVGNFIDESSEDEENIGERSTDLTGTSNDTRTGANEGVEQVDSENGVEEDNAVIDTHSNFGELPEVEPRFMQMEGEVIFGEQDTADIVNISLESPRSLDQHSLVREISEGHIEAPPGDESPHFDFMEFEANGDILDEDLPGNNHHGEAVEERRYFSSKTVIEGTQLTHLEATLLYILEEIQSKNVKIVSVNYCTVARALKRDYDLCFPGKSVKDISKLIKNIIIKAKRDFENQKPILAQSLRADDQRKTRMEETMATILRIDSAAPEAVRRTVRRGISTRRPATDGRPAIPGPEVGMIASQVSGDGQDNYQEQRRRNQEQGAEPWLYEKHKSEQQCETRNSVEQLFNSSGDTVSN